MSSIALIELKSGSVLNSEIISSTVITGAVVSFGLSGTVGVGLFSSTTGLLSVTGFVFTETLLLSDELVVCSV